MVTPPGNILELYINAIVENPPHQSADPSFNGFLPSNLVENYDEGGTSYLGIDIREAEPDPFTYHGSSSDEQHFDVPCQPDDVVSGLLDDSINDNVSVEHNETDEEGPKDGPTRSIKQSSYNAWRGAHAVWTSRYRRERPSMIE